MTINEHETLLITGVDQPAPASGTHALSLFADMQDHSVNVGQGSKASGLMRVRLQYLAGLSANVYEADAIYRDMARYRTYPEGLFMGSPGRMSNWRSPDPRPAATGRLLMPSDGP